jgi:hypothetical protein
MPSSNDCIRRIFKYPIEVESRQMIQMPRGAEILSAGRQGPLPFLWALVDPSEPFEPRIFRNVTTGEEFNDERLVFVGHIQLGGDNDREGWYECFVFEVDTALPQRRPDPISARFRDDMDEIKLEITEAVGTRELVAV